MLRAYLPLKNAAAMAICMGLSVGAMADAPPEDMPLIENKLYPMGFKLELTPMITYSINDKYTHHSGFALSAGFNIFEFLSIEAFGGYNLNGFGEVASAPSWLKTGWTNLTREINNVTHSAGATDILRDKPLELPDLYFQTWFAGADVLFAPFYGKWSIVSELGGSISVYGLLGGGAAGTAKEDYQKPGVHLTGPVVFPVHYGAGVRVHFAKWLALRAELRDYWWINPEVEEQDQNGKDPCVGGYCLSVDGKKQQFTDFSRATFIQAGVSLIF